MIFPILMYGDLAHQSGAVICNITTATGLYTACLPLQTL